MYLLNIKSGSMLISLELIENSFKINCYLYIILF